jgi:hypothetical protein
MSEPFQPFCRQLLINRDNEFETALKQLSPLRYLLCSEQVIANRIVQKSEDRILDELRRDLFKKVTNRIEEYKESWANENLNK